MAIGFIYFDLGNVLLSFTHQRGYSQIAAAARVSTEEVRAAMVRDRLSDRYEAGELSTSDFHSALCEHLNATLSITELSLAWGDIFDMMPQTVALAANLKSAGHRIGILSNTCAIHWEFASTRFPVLSALFEPIVTSYAVGAMKPEASIYHAAASRVDLPPDDLFFVDDREENVQGAMDAGWHAHQFAGAQRLADELESLGVNFNR